MVPIEHVIGLSITLFTIGVVGALVRRNLIVILMSIELMLNAVNLALVGFNRVWAVGAMGEGRLDGQIFVLMIISVLWDPRVQNPYFSSSEEVRGIK